MTGKAAVSQKVNWRVLSRETVLATGRKQDMISNNLLASSINITPLLVPFSDSSPNALPFHS